MHMCRAPDQAIELRKRGGHGWGHPSQPKGWCFWLFGCIGCFLAILCPEQALVGRRRSWQEAAREVITQSLLAAARGDGRGLEVLLDQRKELV